MRKRSKWNIYPNVIKAMYWDGRKNVRKSYGSVTAFNRAKAGLKRKAGINLRRLYR
jgi:hypothetical protein